MVKNSPAKVGDLKDVGSIPGSGRYPGGGHGNPLQYSCLENPMDREAWHATVHRVTKSQTRLKWLSTHVQPIILQFSCSVMSDSLQSHGLQHARPPYPSTPGVYTNSCPLSWWCYYTWKHVKQRNKEIYVKHRDRMVCTVSCQIKLCLRLYHLAANFTFQRWASQKWINFTLHINYSDDFRDLEKSHITFWDTLSRWEKWYTSSINWTASCAWSSIKH